MSTRAITVPESLDLKRTVLGAKQPLMIGPSEAWWSTRTPDGPGSLALQRTTPATVAAEAWGPGADWLLEQAPRLLGLADDIDEFDPTGPIRDLWRRQPFRLARTDRPWDAVVAGILGQKVQATKARASRRAIARRFGEPAPGPRESWILPSIETVSSMSYSDFHQTGVERKRAEIIVRSAREMRRFGEIGDRTPEEYKLRLQRIRGIGPWTANLVTAVAMGDADAVPTGDYHIPNNVAWVLAKEPRADDARMLELLEPYAGHRWRVIRMVKSTGSAPKYGPRLSLNGDGMARGR